MSDDVMCGDCGSVIYESRTVPPEERKPCPTCGSKARKYRVESVAYASVDIRGEGGASSMAGFFISSVSLLLQAVVVPGEKTDDGQLIQLVTPPWGEIVRLLQNNPSVAYQIPWRKWEEIIAGAYKKAGFDEVTLTPRSRDRGRDIIAVKKGIGKVRIIDQVKAYKPGHLVSADEVRALWGVLQGDGASKAFLTTTSDFAPRIKDDPFISQVIPARLELINGEELLKLLEELNEV